MGVLLAVPNVSEGRDRSVIDAVGSAFTRSGAVRLLDVHSDPDHHRSVYTLAGEQGSLADALVDGAAEAARLIDLAANDGVHPHVGAIDVVPIVFREAQQRGAACAEALTAADGIARALGAPVLLYGVLAGGRKRSELRRGGIAELDRRLGAGELTPDYGPARAHPSAGAVLVGARQPLVAFNLLLAPPATLEDARAVATRLREGGPDGLPGVRALGVALTSRGGATQVTFNIEDPAAVPLARLIAAAARMAPVAGAELVGLAPAVAFDGFPADVPIAGFDPQRHLIENALAG